MSDIITAITAFFGVVIAGLGLFYGLRNYDQQVKQKRAEHFFNLRRKFKENEKFNDICSLLVSGSETLKDIPFAEKRNILALFEEIAIMRTSGLVKTKVAYYMFGYYAKECLRNNYFWYNSGIIDGKQERESPYWKVFREFAEGAEKFLNSNSKLDKIKPDEIKI